MIDPRQPLPPVSNLVRQNTSQNIARALQGPGVIGPPIQQPPTLGGPLREFGYANLMRSANLKEAFGGHLFDQPPGSWQGPPGTSDPTPPSGWSPAPSPYPVEAGQGNEDPGNGGPGYGEPVLNPHDTPEAFGNHFPGGGIEPPWLPGNLGQGPGSQFPSGGGEPPMSSGPHPDPYGLDPGGSEYPGSNPFTGSYPDAYPGSPDTQVQLNPGGEPDPGPTGGIANPDYVPNQGESVPGRLLRTLPLPYGANAVADVYHRFAEAYRRNHGQNTPGGNSSTQPVAHSTAPDRSGMHWDYGQGRMVPNDNATGAQFNSRAQDLMTMWSASQAGRANRNLVNDREREANSERGGHMFGHPTDRQGGPPLYATPDSVNAFNAWRMAHQTPRAHSVIDWNSVTDFNRVMRGG